MLGAGSVPAKTGKIDQAENILAFCGGTESNIMRAWMHMRQIVSPAT